MNESTCQNDAQSGRGGQFADWLCDEEIVS